MSKCKIIESHKEETFEPITLQITIESADEFREMWHRMNLSVVTVRDESFEEREHQSFKNTDLSYDLWSFLDRVNREKYNDIVNNQ